VRRKTPLASGHTESDFPWNGGRKYEMKIVSGGYASGDEAERP
jgi:hypothetical protein